MARGATITAENNFTQGLITEFSAMNFPENAVTDGDNVVFSELGKVTRRNGIDIEEDGTIHALSSLSSNTGAYVEYKWDSVGGIGTTSFEVQQIGSKINFFTVNTIAISSELKSFSINLLDHKTSVPDTNVANFPCQFTSGKGFLFIAHPFCEPLSVEYNNTTDTITVTEIELEIRDFERLDDGLDNSTRPTTLSKEHHYNLFNQGWYDSAIISGDGSPRQVLDTWHSSRSNTDYPSNSDVWWVFKGGLEVAYFGQDYKDGHIGPSQIALGNTPSSNGHYIYPAWLIDRSTASGIPGIPLVTSGQARPSCIAFYAGRIFYAGIGANKYGDKIYFTQIVESDDQFGKCYQINDPTSETIFDLLDSDGGVISIPLIAKVISLQVVNDSLIVIGSNGVFAIRGTENGPFRATDYSVEYVSEVGGVSHLSVVNVDNSLLWWNYDALYALTKDQIGVYYQVQNASRSTIQSIINSVPPVNKLYIKGVHNKKDRVVQWLYNDDIDADAYTYNRILEFNVVSKAFYTHTIDTSKTPRVVGILSISGQQKSTFLTDVQDNTFSTVTNNALQVVQIEEEAFTPNVEVFKYSVSGNISSGSPGFTYASQVPTHKDWGSISGGSSFSSYFISGYRIRGELLRSFTSTPIAVILDNIDDAEVVFKGIWDYGFRTSMPQRLYGDIKTTDTSRGWDRGDYIIRRVKSRGKGKSLQLSFESLGDAPFSVVGWSTFDTGGQQP